jgi:succinylglutamate desuccinylase
MTDLFPLETRDRLSRLLERFRAIAQPGPFSYRWCHSSDGGRHPTHIVFGAMIHGDEFGSLPAVVRLVEGLISGDVRFGGRVTVFIGNPEAARENVRFIEADLNRVFLDNDGDAHEHNRARALMKILDTADVFVDFHQTILATRCPFYIFPWHVPGWHWARALQSADVWVTRDPRSQFSYNSRCSDEYVCQTGRPGLTVELSQKGFSDAAAALCWDTMIRALRHADSDADIAQIAESEPDLTTYTTVHTEPFATPQHALMSGLVNFQPVVAGQQLSAAASPEIVVPAEGMLLFPKYPPREGDRATAPRPKDIYRLITPLLTHPSILWADDDE